MYSVLRYARTPMSIFVWRISHSRVYQRFESSKIGFLGSNCYLPGTSQSSKVHANFNQFLARRCGIFLLTSEVSVNFYFPGPRFWMISKNWIHIPDHLEFCLPICEPPGWDGGFGRKMAESNNLIWKLVIFLQFASNWHYYFMHYSVDGKNIIVSRISWCDRVKINLKLKFWPCTGWNLNILFYSLFFF